MSGAQMNIADGRIVSLTNQEEALALIEAPSKHGRGYAVRQRAQGSGNVFVLIQIASHMRIFHPANEQRDVLGINFGTQKTEAAFFILLTSP